MCSRSLVSPKIRFRRPKECLDAVPTTTARLASTEALGWAGRILPTPRFRPALQCCWSLRPRSLWPSFLLAPILLPSSQVLLLFPAARGWTLLGRLLHELASVHFTPSTASSFLLPCLCLASLLPRAPWRCVRGGSSRENEGGTAGGWNCVETSLPPHTIEQRKLLKEGKELSSEAAPFRSSRATRQQPSGLVCPLGALYGIGAVRSGCQHRIM